MDEWGLRCISDEELRAETERTARAVTTMRDNVAKEQQAALALQSMPDLLETYRAMHVEYRRTLERTEAKLRACEAEEKRRREQADCPLECDVPHPDCKQPKPCAQEPVTKRPRRRAAIDGEAKRHKGEQKLEETQWYSRGFGRRVTQ